MQNKIVILGAGYSGMLIAQKLEKSALEFVLINRNPYHYFTTQLHEVAGERAVPMDYAVSLTEMFQGVTSHVLIDEVVHIDRQQQVVYLASGNQQSYDWLIVTLGSVPEYFGIPGLAEHSLVLDSLSSATNIHDHIVKQIGLYREDKNAQHLCILVGGGGLTGIELIGELLDLVPQLCLKYGISPELVEIEAVEASSEILPQLSHRLRQTAVEFLISRGAKLNMNKRIVNVTERGIEFDDKRVLQVGTFIWTGGVRANPVLAESGFTVNRRGRAKVTQYLQSVDDPHVFIGGDSAWYDAEGSGVVPPTAQMALQMGQVIAHNTKAAIRNRPMQAFHPRSLGTLASLGRTAGVGTVLGLPVRGALGGMLKEGTKLKYLWELGGLRLVDEKVR